MNRRAAIIVLDGLGIGAAADAHAYGDVGSDTLGNLARAIPNFALPALEALGLGTLAPIAGLSASVVGHAARCTMQPASPGKDSTTGHWELCGLHLARPFPTYPQGFPVEVVSEFERLTGRAVIANVVGSGTKVVRQMSLKGFGEIVLEAVKYLAAQRAAKGIDALQIITGEREVALLRGQRTQQGVLRFVHILYLVGQDVCPARFVVVPRLRALGEQGQRLRNQVIEVGEARLLEA